jgi:flagellar hook assembly protein FlgD
MLGKVVKTVTRESVNAGVQLMEWDGQTDDGGTMDSGMYFCQLRGDRGVLSSPKRVIKR